MQSIVEEGDVRRQKAEALLKALSGDEPRKEEGK
jgi:hypothetical protein